MAILRAFAGEVLAANTAAGETACVVATAMRPALKLRLPSIAISLGWNVTALWESTSSELGNAAIGRVAQVQAQTLQAMTDLGGELTLALSPTV